MESAHIMESYNLRLPKLTTHEMAVDEVTHIRMQDMSCSNIIEVLRKDIEEITELKYADVINEVSSKLLRCVGNAIVHLGPDADVIYVIDYVHMLFIGELEASNMHTLFTGEIFDIDSPLNSIIRAVWLDTFKFIFKKLGTEDVFDVTAMLSPEYHPNDYIIQGVYANDWLSVISFKENYA